MGISFGINFGFLMLLSKIIWESLKKIYSILDELFRNLQVILFALILEYPKTENTMNPNLKSQKVEFDNLTFRITKKSSEIKSEKLIQVI
jgi:hypothetical protein